MSVESFNWVAAIAVTICTFAARPVGSSCADIAMRRPQAPVSSAWTWINGLRETTGEPAGWVRCKGAVNCTWSRPWAAGAASIAL